MYLYTYILYLSRHWCLYICFLYTFTMLKPLYSFARCIHLFQVGLITFLNDFHPSRGARAGWMASQGKPGVWVGEFQRKAGCDDAIAGWFVCAARSYPYNLGHAFFGSVPFIHKMNWIDELGCRFYNFSNRDTSIGAMVYQCDGCLPKVEDGIHTLMYIGGFVYIQSYT